MEKRCQRSENDFWENEVVDTRKTSNIEFEEFIHVRDMALTRPGAETSIATPSKAMAATAKKGAKNKGAAAK